MAGGREEINWILPADLSNCPEKISFHMEEEMEDGLRAMD